MKNLVRDALDRRGITPIEAHRRGMPYQSVYRQYHGTRKLSAEYAITYEQVLGIPREELRPDLWPPTEAAPTMPDESGQCGECLQPVVGGVDTRA